MRAAVTLTAALILAPLAALAEPSRCLIEVDGELYVLGRCNVDTAEEGRSVSIGGGPRKVASQFFADISTGDDGKWLASWSKEPGSTHAHAALGEMTKRGACWINDRAKLCAWPMPAKGPSAGMMNTRPR